MDNNDLGNCDQLGILDNSHVVPTTAADPANFSVFGQGANGVVGPSSGLINISDWAHITLTWTQTATQQTLKLYIDGSPTATQTITGIWGGVAGNRFGIGGHGEAPNFREGAAFSTIDEVRIKNVVLNDAQVLADYTQMAVNKIQLTADADTTFLTHFNTSTTADFAAGTGTATFAGGSTGLLSTDYPFVAVVPEPASVALMGLGALAILRRR